MNMSTMAGQSPSVTQSRRPIRLRLLHQTKVLDDVLLVKHVHGHETLCGGIEYRLHCVSTQTSLPLKEFMASPIELQFVTDQGQLRTEYTDVTGEITPTKLRARITDPRIKGPIETGWGAADYTREEAKRILLTVPASS